MMIATAALDYATRGIPVFPLHTPVIAADGAAGCSCSRARCKDQGKHPRTARGLHDATTDAEQVRAWWQRWPDANIGARTGITFDVCDIDTDQAATRLDAEGLTWPTGPATATGKGRHLFVAPTGHGNRIGMLPGVDWRGRGGYVVLPPSLHPSGRRYRWIRDLETQIPDAPAELLRLLAPATAGTDAGASYSPPAVPHAWARAALEREAAKVATAPEKQHSATLNRAAFKLGQLVGGGMLDEEAARAALTEAAARCPRCRPDAARVIRCGMAAGKARPRNAGKRS